MARNKYESIMGKKKYDSPTDINIEKLRAALKSSRRYTPSTREGFKKGIKELEAKKRTSPQSAVGGTTTSKYMASRYGIKEPKKKTEPKTYSLPGKKKTTAKKTAKKKTSSKKSLDELSFSKAFAKKRDEGAKVFEWRGKKYTTKLASEAKKKPGTSTAKKKESRATRTAPGLPVSQEGRRTKRTRDKLTKLRKETGHSYSSKPATERQKKKRAKLNERLAKSLERDKKRAGKDLSKAKSTKVRRLEERVKNYQRALRVANTAENKKVARESLAKAKRDLAAAKK